MQEKKKRSASTNKIEGGAPKRVRGGRGRAVPDANEEPRKPGVEQRKPQAEKVKVPADAPTGDKTHVSGKNLGKRRRAKARFNSYPSFYYTYIIIYIFSDALSSPFVYRSDVSGLV